MHRTPSCLVSGIYVASIRRRAGAFEVREGTPADRPYHLGGHRTWRTLPQS
jgi:hypothetical protein